MEKREDKNETQMKHNEAYSHDENTERYETKMFTYLRQNDLLHVILGLGRANEFQAMLWKKTTCCFRYLIL